MMSRLLTRESTIIERPLQLSMAMALALPLTLMMLLLQRVMRMDWFCWAETSMISSGLSKFSMSHLLPSRSLRGGLRERMLSGLGFLLGAGDLPRDKLGRSGAVDPARKLGFLCVISDLSTLRRPEVICSPWLSWSNTADMSGAGAVGAGAGGIPGGGGGGGAPPPGTLRAGTRGGGGGGGTAPAPAGVDPPLICFKASSASTPDSLFHVKPLG